MARKAKSKRYFTQITEMAINAYNRSDDQRLKNKIYNRFIHYPFDKLGSFEANDETGYVFKELYEIVEQLEVYYNGEKSKE